MGKVVLILFFFRSGPVKYDTFAGPFYLRAGLPTRPHFPEFQIDRSFLLRCRLNWGSANHM
jgi:hypothetical protein